MSSVAEFAESVDVIEGELHDKLPTAEPSLHVTLRYMLALHVCSNLFAALSN